MLEHLQLDEKARRRLEPHWAQSLRDFDGRIPQFLEDGYLLEAMALAGIPEECRGEVLAAAAAVRAKRTLTVLAWHVHYMLIHEEDWLGDYPDVAECDSGMFYLLAALALAGPIRESFRQKGIPDEYLDCCRRIEGYRRTYLAGYGRNGLNKTQIHWIRHYYKLRCFRVGRLEYMPTSNALYNIQVFRHRTDGRIQALSGDAAGRFDREGWRMLQAEDPARAVISGGYVMTPERIVGVGFRPNGRAALEPVTLELPEWERVLGPDDPVLGLHIPEGGAMTPDKCRDSLVRAPAFFDRYFPELKPKAVCCMSWIFWPWYQEVIPESNIAKFQRMLHLYPSPSAGNDGEYFIFGRADKRYDEYGRDNSMRRLLLSLLEAGKPLRAGGMFLLREEIERLGPAVAR